MSITAKDEAREVDRLAARLATLYSSIPAEQIGDLVASIHQQFDGAPIRAFVPVLVERAARNRLSRLRGAEAQSHAPDSEAEQVGGKIAVPASTHSCRGSRGLIRPFMPAIRAVMPIGGR